LIARARIDPTLWGLLDPETFTIESVETPVVWSLSDI